MKIEEALNRALPSIARRLWNELTIVCPVDTSRLVNSIKVKATNEGLIIWMVDYGKYVEFGTPPHVIKAKPGKSLVIPKFGGRLVKRKGDWKTEFKFGGKKAITDVIFVKQVRHPGSRPNPFIRNTLQNKLRGIIVEELMKEIS